MSNRKNDKKTVGDLRALTLDEQQRAFARLRFEDGEDLRDVADNLGLSLAQAIDMERDLMRRIRDNNLSVKRKEQTHAGYH